MKHYDIIVAGGGFAGVGAAVAAARMGRSVLLIEEKGCLGGAAANSLVLPFMPYYTFINQPDGKWEMKYLVRGIFREITEKLHDRDEFDVNFFNTDYLKYVLDNLVLQSGAEVLFHSRITDVTVRNRRLESVITASRGGKNIFGADCFIDATGDANLVCMSGCGFTLGRSGDHLCQPMTLCFRISGVNMAEFERELPKMQQLYKEYLAAGRLRNVREDILAFRTVDENIIHLNSTRVVKLDPTDPFALSRAEVEGRAQMVELADFLKSNFDICKNLHIVSSAPEIGVRESRMAAGEHLLTGRELVDTVKFPDAIAAGNYEIDIHNPEGSGTSHYYFPAGEYYTVPYRSLVVRDADNLLVAGRCISCDHEAQASVRIMPICCATGQAAGTAAALFAGGDKALRDADISLLRAALIEQGAFLGD